MKIKQKKYISILHRLYPPFLGLPEIPVVPQGFTDLIATALVDWSTDLINRLIEVRVLQTRLGQRHSSKQRALVSPQTRPLIPHFIPTPNSRYPKHTWPAGSAHSCHQGPSNDHSEKAKRRHVAKKRRLSLKWVRYPLHNSPSKEFRLFNTILECTIYLYIFIYILYIAVNISRITFDKYSCLLTIRGTSASFSTLSPFDLWVS